MSFSPVILEDLEAIIKEPIQWEKLKGKTVLITGVNGMIASYLVYTLLHLNDVKQFQIEVIGLVRNEEKAKRQFGDLLERKDFHLLVQDVTKPILYDGKVEYIIHAASQTGPRQFTEDPVGTIAANTVGTIGMLELAREKKVEGFLFLSTREIYGKNPPEKEFVTEEEYGSMDPTLIRSCYPESKRISETLCASYASQYGVPCHVARIAHTYGPGILIGDGRVVGDFLNNVVHRENIVLNSDGSAILALTYISDTVSGLFYTMLNFTDFVYNISSDKEIISVKQLANTLCKLFPERGLTATFQPIDESKKAGYLAHKVALLSSKKAEAEGWMPKVDLALGMKKTVNFIEEKMK